MQRITTVLQDGFESMATVKERGFEPETDNEEEEDLFDDEENEEEKDEEE